MYVHNKHTYVCCKYLCIILHAEPLSHIFARYSPIHPCTPPSVLRQPWWAAWRPTSGTGQWSVHVAQAYVLTNTYVHTYIHTYICTCQFGAVCTYVHTTYLLRTVCTLQTHVHSVPASQDLTLTHQCSLSVVCLMRCRYCTCTSMFVCTVCVHTYVHMKKGSSRIPASKQGWKPCRHFDQMLWPSSGQR